MSDTSPPVHPIWGKSRDAFVAGVKRLAAALGVDAALIDQVTQNITTTADLNAVTAALSTAPLLNRKAMQMADGRVLPMLSAGAGYSPKNLIDVDGTPHVLLLVVDFVLVHPNVRGGILNPFIRVAFTPEGATLAGPGFVFDSKDETKCRYNQTALGQIAQSLAGEPQELMHRVITGFSLEDHTSDAGDKVRTAALAEIGYKDLNAFTLTPDLIAKLPAFFAMVDKANNLTGDTSLVANFAAVMAATSTPTLGDIAGICRKMNMGNMGMLPMLDEDAGTIVGWGFQLMLVGANGEPQEAITVGVNLPDASARLVGPGIDVVTGGKAPATLEEVLAEVFGPDADMNDIPEQDIEEIRAQLVAPASKFDKDALLALIVNKAGVPVPALEAFKAALVSYLKDLASIGIDADGVAFAKQALDLLEPQFEEIID
jgi:hypothetical protein